jgi:hypothetical protein
MSRAALAILNELSLPSAEVEADRIEALVDEFVQVLLAARRIRDDLALVSNTRLTDIPVGDTEMGLSAFLQQRGGRSRENLRFLLALVNHAPFARAPSLTIPDGGEEFRFDDRPSQGLGFAAVNRQLATSLDSAQWPDTTMSVDRLWLEEDDQEGEVLREAAAEVRHAATVDHVGSNAQFLRELTLPQPLTGSALWEDRSQVFPRLLFLPRVQEQVSSVALGSERLTSIFQALTKLNRAMGEWDRDAEAFPQWGIRVTPEHEQRKRLCFFDDLDGSSRCFDLHARFNPAPGRIHFRIREEDEVLVIAHIGPKL